MAPTITTGSVIRSLRKRRGLGLVETASLAGLDKGHLSRIERDQADPSLSALRSIARVLRVRPARLLPGTVSAP